MDGRVPGLVYRKPQEPQANAEAEDNVNSAIMESPSATIAGRSNAEIRYKRTPEWKHGIPEPEIGRVPGHEMTVFLTGFGHGIEPRFAKRTHGSGSSYGGWSAGTIDDDEEEIIRYRGHGRYRGPPLSNNGRRGLGLPGRALAADDVAPAPSPSRFLRGRGQPVFCSGCKIEPNRTTLGSSGTDDVRHTRNVRPSHSQHSEDTTTAELTSEVSEPATGKDAVGKEAGADCKEEKDFTTLEDNKN